MSSFQMNAKSSLFFLADVALHTLNDTDNNSLNVLRRRETKLRILNVNNLNGEFHADINDLKNMPISILFNWFIDKVDDEHLRYIVYVCKFGVQSSYCKMKFMDSRNKIHALEHLVRCHLLEHLTKIKSGVMIKLPEKSVSAVNVLYMEKSSKNFIPKRTENTEIGSIYDNVHVKPISAVTEYKLQTYSSSVFDKLKAKDVRINSKSPYVEETHLKNSIVVDHRNSLEETSMEIISDIESEKTMITDIVSESPPKEFIFDHSYAATGVASTVPKEGIDFICNLSHNIDVNNLYRLNSELSNELHNFMNFETLDHPVNIFMLEGKQLLIEQLPVVGSQVEISTVKKYCSDTFEVTTLSGQKIYRCPKCFKMYPLKKSLYAHFKGDCNIQRNARSQKMTKIRPSGEENKPVKRKVPLQDKNNNHILFQLVKKNSTTMDDLTKRRNSSSILKTALLKNSNVKKPIINISNIWSNINVQYV